MKNTTNLDAVRSVFNAQSSIVDLIIYVSGKAAKNEEVNNLKVLTALSAIHDTMKELESFITQKEGN